MYTYAASENHARGILVKLCKAYFIESWAISIHLDNALIRSSAPGDLRLALGARILLQGELRRELPLRIRRLSRVNPNAVNASGVNRANAVLEIRDLTQDGWLQDRCDINLCCLRAIPALKSDEALNESRELFHHLLDCYDQRVGTQSSKIKPL